MKKLGRTIHSFFLYLKIWKQSNTFLWWALGYSYWSSVFSNVFTTPASLTFYINWKFHKYLIKANFDQRVNKLTKHKSQYYLNLRFYLRLCVNAITLFNFLSFFRLFSKAFLDRMAKVLCVFFFFCCSRPMWPCWHAMCFRENF